MFTFLHTACAHIDSFESLVRERTNGLPVRHEVHEGLLADSVAEGASLERVRAAVHGVIRELAGEGSGLIVCTCSTIGAVAEEASGPGCRVMRIDRPMAERAVASGRRVVLIAALPTALRETAALLQRVALDTRRSLEVEEVSLPQAWPCFVRGDTAGYLAEVGHAIGTKARAGDVVVLAQASMAAVTELYQWPDVSVLSSPRLGVAAALAEYRSIVAAGDRRS